MVFANDFQGGIGIDLGTTYSCVAAMNADGRIEVIANEQGNRTTPSYVAFNSATERLVGDAAKNQAAMNPKNTVFDAKRLIGRRFDETSVQKDRVLWPFTVVDVNGAPHIKIECIEKDNVFSPQAISALVLSKMKEIAEMKLGENVTKAVVTVPAYFNDAQRQATKDAGVIAGLEVLRIINEPTAAAIAYGLDQRQKDSAAGVTDRERVVLIFDLGGGTFDVSLLVISDGVFTVKATAGDTHLGGEDFDNAMVKHFVEDFKKRHGAEIDISSDPRALRRLRSACERAKRTLSTLTKATIEIDCLCQSVDYTATCTRAKFEELNADYFNLIVGPVNQVFEDAKMSMSQVDEIVLVGGSTRIPKIQSLLAGVFGCPVEKLNKSINPDEAVAYGAAVQAAILTGTACGTTGDLLLHDVVPLSLGIEMQGGIMAVVVPRNTAIPTTMKKMFTTSHDSQTTVEFPVFEGERLMTKENNPLGTFTLSGLPPAPRNVPELETTFDIDANGLLKITAVELISRRSADITITNKPGRLEPKEIERLVAEAAKHREADAEQSSRAEERYSLQEYVSSSKTQLLNAGLASRLRGGDEALEQLEKAMEWLEVSGDTASREKLATYRRNLERTVIKAVAAIYETEGSQQQQSRRGGRNRRG